MEENSKKITFENNWEQNQNYNEVNQEENNYPRLHQYEMEFCIVDIAGVQLPIAGGIQNGYNVHMEAFFHQSYPIRFCK